jgi:alkaline phosphatase
VKSEHDTDQSTPANTPVDRRTFLGAIGAGLALGYGAAASRFPSSQGSDATTSVPKPSQPRKAQNLILMVADGMSAGTLQLADLQLRQTRDRQSHWISLIQRGDGATRSVVDTASFNSLVTDSAAAASAWGIGHLVENGRIGECPDQKVRSPLLLRAKEAGKATGLVTTTRLTHATPAGFACNVIGGDRNDEGRIAKQLIDREYDLLLGGGARYLADLATQAGLSPVSDKASLANRLAQSSKTEWSERDRLIGLFQREHLSYELDRPETEPPLAELTRTSLEWLGSGPGGFVVQIEGGRVDHAAHSNDAGSLVADQIAFDDALGAALEFVQNRDDTLLVVTTDHGNANPGLTDYTRYGIEGFARLGGIAKSFDWIMERFDRIDRNNTAEIHSVVESATNISLSRPDLETLRRWLAGETVDPFLLANRKCGPLGSVLANYTKVAFMSPNHTADYVELTACGPGATGFGPIMRIDQIHGVLCSALDLPTEVLL